MKNIKSIGWEVIEEPRLQEWKDHKIANMSLEESAEWNEYKQAIAFMVNN